MSVQVPEFKIKAVKPSELLDAYKPDEVWGHCANCGNHASVWSCPPHRFDPAEFIEGFNYAYVVVGTVSLSGFEKQDEAIRYYYEMRREINRSMLAFEATEPGAVCLFAGHCDACMECTRIDGDACVHPELCRYSLESLGLKVSDITETHFGEMLQWAAGTTPEKLLTVPALLSPVPVDVGAFLQVLES